MAAATGEESLRRRSQLLLITITGSLSVVLLREEIMRSSRDQFVMFINDCPKTVAGAKGDCVPKFVS
ncbi:unnamed protein product [Brassica oleracea var. botrytis]